MKRICIVDILIFLSAFSVSAIAQQNAQWPFYLAFEDATGAKDTIWMVLDEMAHNYEMDPAFGEVPIDIPLMNFVFMQDIHLQNILILGHGI